MSAFGTKRTSNDRLAMSAFGGKADVKPTSLNVRFCPKADIKCGFREHARCFAKVSGIFRIKASRSPNLNVTVADTREQQMAREMAQSAHLNAGN